MLSEEHKRKISEAHKRIGAPWNVGRKRPDLSLRNKQTDRKGSNNLAWKGGITPHNKLIRRSVEYKLWRKSVFVRDKYTCIWCGIKSQVGVQVILHADHIKPFAHYPELRFAIDNGRTLCIDCHKTTDSYGGKGKKSNH